MNRRILIVACRVTLGVMAIGYAATAVAWGPDGHRIVCEIAWQEAKPAGKQLVAALMSGDSEDASFASSCNWPDRLRSDARFDWVKPLHYVDVPAGKSFDAQAHCKPEGCAARAIGQNARVLADPTAPTKARREALKYLGHFLGDLHQPLHAGYPSDVGGNSIRTRLCASECRYLKLHAVWDSGIIEAEQQDWQALANELEGQITDEQRTAWRHLAMKDLIAESSGLAESRAYRPVSNGTVQDGYIGDLPQPVKLDASYAATMSPVVREQLQKAGVRLAMALDALAAREVPDGLTQVAPLYATPSDAATKGLFVRSQPKTSSAKLTTLMPGDRVEILGEVVVEYAADWYVVRLADGRQAYVRTDYADVTQ